MFQLVHSPSVGPGTWEPVAACLRALGHRVAVPDMRPVARASPPYWRTLVELASTGLRGMPLAEPVVLCAHSNAGVFLPLIAANLGRPVAGLVFVDASVPPERGEAEMVPAEFLHDLRRRAIEGFLPRWTDWWPEADVAALFADEMTRQQVVAEQVQLPLAYYEEKVPVPEDWQRIPSAYLLFGPPYNRLADEARARGWPVRTVSGEHLHMVVDPPRVARALLAPIETRSGSLATSLAVPFVVTGVARRTAEDAAHLRGRTAQSCHAGRVGWAALTAANLHRRTADPVQACQWDGTWWAALTTADICR